MAQRQKFSIFRFIAISRLYKFYQGISAAGNGLLWTRFRFFLSPFREDVMLVITFGGKKKESLKLRLWNLNICIEKVEAKCGLGEMTLVMTSLPLASMFFNVCLHSRLFPLHSDWRKSDSSVDGEPQGNHRRNSNSRDVVASSPSFSRPIARTPRRACSRASYPSPLCPNQLLP